MLLTFTNISFRRKKKRKLSSNSEFLILSCKQVKLQGADKTLLKLISNLKKQNKQKMLYNFTEVNVLKFFNLLGFVTCPPIVRTPCTVAFFLVGVFLGDFDLDSNSVQEHSTRN